MQKTTRFTYWVIYSMLIYLPFHALISTWIISLFGQKLPVKGLKELVILLAVVPLVFILINRRHFLKIRYPWLWGSIAAYCLSIIFVLILRRDSSIVTIAGLIELLRFIGFFAMCYLVAMLLPTKFTPQDRAMRVVFFCSIAVVAFGALQVLVLPKDFLTHFGYGPNTIVPYGTVDNNESYIRILSTLRGPNPLGAYLAFISPIGLYMLSKAKKIKWWFVLLYTLAFVITIYGSQSRSGWIGLLAGLGVVGILTVKNKKPFILAGLVAVTALSILFAARNTQFVQVTLMHRDPNESVQIDSDDQRIESIKKSIIAVHERPLGHGIGTSGPPSNYSSKPFIIENTYLDVAYQAGWLGMVFFMTINVVVGVMLYKLKNILGYSLLAGLVAISIIGLFWPVWSDETVALTWWGLAGLALGASIVEQKSNRRSIIKPNAKTK